jgi:hypothetical protein
MYPEPTMIRNRSSPIIPKEDTESSTESDSSGSERRVPENAESDSSSVEWWGPENQLGLEPGDQFGLRRDDQVVALDKKGEIKHYEAIAKY